MTWLPGDVLAGVKMWMKNGSAFREIKYVVRVSL
jgi:hypothetical protein